MMNKNNSKVLLNGVLLAAIAAVGVSTYQFLTSPDNDSVLPNEVQVRMNETMDTRQTDDMQERDSEDGLGWNTNESKQTEENLVTNTQNVEAEVEMENSEAEGETMLDTEAKDSESVETGAVKYESEGTVMTDSEAEGTAIMDSESEETAVTEFEIEQSVTEDMEHPEAEETMGDFVDAVLPASAYLEFSEDTMMEWPVQGNILLDYSMDETIYFPTLDQYRMNPAISVQAPVGNPVQASVSGVVYKISEDAKTGTTVTMELGNGYQAIYGQLSDLTVYEGEVVKKGTVIGFINEPTKYYSKEGSNLYFAMKKDGNPIDPIIYLP